MGTQDIKFRKTSDTTYAKTLRGYTATITVNLNGDCTLVIVGAGGPYETQHETLRQAKNAFRKFLLDKSPAEA